jgi:hypothetical protein
MFKASEGAIAQRGRVILRGDWKSGYLCALGVSAVKKASAIDSLPP